MTYDPTTEPLHDNIVLACGGLAGWASFVKSCPRQVGPEDVAMRPYVLRAMAVIRDIISGTPDANTSLYTCDIPDSQLADKLSPYIVIVMRSQDARDRNVPTSLQRAVTFLKEQAPLV
jgi:hypothetical protein